MPSLCLLKEVREGGEKAEDCSVRQSIDIQMRDVKEEMLEIVKQRVEDYKQGINLGVSGAFDQLKEAQSTVQGLIQDLMGQKLEGWGGLKSRVLTLELELTKTQEKLEGVLTGPGKETEREGKHVNEAQNGPIVNMTKEPKPNGLGGLGDKGGKGSGRSKEPGRDIKVSGGVGGGGGACNIVGSEEGRLKRKAGTQTQNRVDASKKPREIAAGVLKKIQKGQTSGSGVMKQDYYPTGRGKNQIYNRSGRGTGNLTSSVTTMSSANGEGSLFSNEPGGSSEGRKTDKSPWEGFNYTERAGRELASKNSSGSDKSPSLWTWDGNQRGKARGSAIYFRSGGWKWGPLSNFYEWDVPLVCRLGGREYRVKSSEYLYQMTKADKHGEYDAVNQIYKASSSKQAME